MKMPMAIIAAHAMAMAMAVTAASIGLDGNSVPQEGRRKNIITESTLQEFRVFVTRSGKTVKGRVRAYNPDNGIVAIAKENGKTHKIDLSIFSKADQAYVREWHLIKAFFSQDRFHISVRKKRSGAGTELLIWRSEVEIVYGIMLENRSDYDLEGLSVAYCIYCEPDRSGYREQVESQGIKCGTLNIGTLAAGEKTQVETQPVVVPNEGGLEYYKDNKVPSEKTLGIWVRIYLPLADKRRAMREFAMPNSIMKTRKWASSDAPSSQNNWQENQR